MTASYTTQFGSLDGYEKGRVEAISDNVRNYAFSNCFEIANASRPYERVIFGINQIHVLEVMRAEGDSPWFTCAHDEFALCMDGEVEVCLCALEPRKIPGDPNKNGAVLLNGEPLGPKMGWMKLKRGHQGLLPANRAYRVRSAQPSVLILQTCKGDLSIERWAQICQVR